MAVEIGALRAILSLESAAFEKGAKRAQASMNGLQRSLAQASDKLRGIGRTMSMRVTAPLAAISTVAVKTSLATIDAQAKLAQSLGTTTSSMQVLARAADRAGISSGELEQVSRQLTRRLSQAATGAGPAVDALNQLGLSGEALMGVPLDERIATINAAIADMVPEAQQAAVAAKIFGDRAGLLALRLDPATIATAADEMERFGVTVTDIEADRIEEANDAISALGLVSRGLANQLAVALAPILQDIAEKIADVGAWFANLSPQMQRVIGVGAALAAALGPLALAAGFLAAGLAVLVSPLGLVVGALALVAAGAAAVALNWSALVERFPALGVAAERVMSALSAAWDGIKGVFGAASDAVTAAVNAVSALLEGDFDGALASARDAATAFGRVWAETFDGVRNIAAALMPDLYRAGADIVQAVANGIRGVASDVRDAVADLADWIVDGLRAIPGRIAEAARNVGRSIWQGMVAGIMDGEPAVGSASRAAAKRALEATRDEIDARSPSREFMKIGDDMMAGLGLGIAGGAQGAAAQAAQAAADAMAAAQDGIDATQSSALNLEGAWTGFFNAVARGASVADAAMDQLRNTASQLASSLLNAGIQGIGAALFPGVISAPAPLSFAGGGYTGDGARAGGLDGQGGFMAMLHPRETVVDHTRGAGMTVTVHNYASAEVTATEGPGGRLDIRIDDMVSGAMAGGPKTRKVMRAMGLR